MSGRRDRRVVGRELEHYARINRYQVGDADSETACDEAFAEIMGLTYPEPAAAD